MKWNFTSFFLYQESLLKYNLYMKFQINLETIKEYLKRLSISVQSNSSRVEFTGVLINVFDQSIVFESRNDWMDTKIIEDSQSSIKVFETGRILVKAQILNEVVQKMEGQVVTFSKNDSSMLTVEDNDSKYQLNLLDDGNFERANYLNEFNKEVLIPSKVLREAIWKTAFAGKELHSKFIYQGLNITIQGGKFAATATDGTRVASWSTNIESSETFSKIIPLKVVKELLKILPDEGDFKFNFNHNKCVLVSSKMINQFSIIEGTFPTFDKFFNPEIYNKKIIVDKEVINNAIERATILTNVNEDSSKMKIMVSTENFTLEGGGESGSTKVEVRGYDFNGEAIEIAMAPKIIKDGIKHIDTEKLEILMLQSDSPVLVRSTKGNFKYLMSPMT